MECDEAETIRLNKLEAELNAREADPDRQLRLEQEAYEQLEPSIREHNKALLAGKAAAVKKFVK